MPIGYKDNVQLSNWVSTQRQEFKLMKEGRSSRLNKRKIELLEEVGFVWEAQRGGPRRKKPSGPNSPPRPPIQPRNSSRNRLSVPVHRLQDRKGNLMRRRQQEEAAAAAGTELPRTGEVVTGVAQHLQLPPPALQDSDSKGSSADHARVPPGSVMMTSMAPGPAFVQIGGPVAAGAPTYRLAGPPIAAFAPMGRAAAPGGHVLYPGATMLPPGHVVAQPPTILFQQPHVMLHPGGPPPNMIHHAPMYHQQPPNATMLVNMQQQVGGQLVPGQQFALIQGAAQGPVPSAILTGEETSGVASLAMMRSGGVGTLASSPTVQQGPTPTAPQGCTVTNSAKKPIAAPQGIVHGATVRANNQGTTKDEPLRKSPSQNLSVAVPRKEGTATTPSREIKIATGRPVPSAPDAGVFEDAEEDVDEGVADMTQQYLGSKR